MFDVGAGCAGDAALVSLLERIQNSGDERAWRQFIDLATPLVFGWMQRMTFDVEDAADLTQDVLTALVEELPEFRYDRQKSFRGWLRTLARNKWRAQRRRRAAELLDPDDRRLRDLPSRDGADPFWEAEFRRQLAAQAFEVMQADFEPSTWQACWEHLVENCSAAEVGQKFGMTPAAVYAAKSRVLRRLRRKLGRQFGR